MIDKVWVVRWHDVWNDFHILQLRGRVRFELCHEIVDKRIEITMKSDVSVIQIFPGCSSDRHVRKVFGDERGVEKDKKEI